MEATLNGTPALLVKGSGKAADVIADCVLMRFTFSHKHYIQPEHRTEDQTKLHTLIEYFTEMYSSYADRLPVLNTTKTNSTEESEDHAQSGAGEYVNFSCIIQLLDAVLGLSKTSVTCVEKEPKGAQIKNAALAAALQKGQTKFEKKELEDFKLGNLLTNDSYITVSDKYFVFASSDQLDISEKDLAAIESGCCDILEAYDLKTDKTKKGYQKGACINVKHIFCAVATDMCWVYDLTLTAPDAPNFKGSLLRCHNHVEHDIYMCNENYKRNHL